MNNVPLLAVLSLLLANPSFATSQVDFVRADGTLKASSRSLSLMVSASVSLGRPNGANLMNLANLATVRSHAKLSPGIPLGRMIEAKAFPAGMLFSGTFSGPNGTIVKDQSGMLQGDTKMSIPEPGSVSLMATGLFGLLLAALRKLES